jgi:hypothetical protein
VGVYFGAPWYWGWGAWPWVYGYPYGYSVYEPYPYYGPTDPPAYVPPESPEQEAAPAPASYWYYCTEPPGYYPYIQQCKNPWIPVMPQNVPPDAGIPPSQQ